MEQEIELLSSLPNVLEYKVPDGCKLCVVGEHSATTRNCYKILLVLH